MAYGKALHYIEADVHGEEGKIGTVNIGYDLGKAYSPSHTYFACPSCGVVWGKILLDTSRKARHIYQASTCRTHGGGVFSSRLDVFYLDRFDLDFSMEVLKQDFLVMYDWCEGLVSPEVEPTECKPEDWTVPISLHSDKKPGSGRL